MLRTKIKDIVILYDESKISEIEHIKRIINNNYILLSGALSTCRTISLTPTDDENIVYIANFDEFFDKLIDKSYNDETTKNNLSSIDLVMLYVEYLIRKANDKGLSQVVPDFNIDDEMLHAIIAYKYFEVNGSFADFTNYLKGDQDFTLIESWLKDNMRYPTYNYLIETIIDYLQENDFEFLDKISEILDAILKQTIDFILNHEKKETVIPSVSTEEIDSLFIQFLKFINAPDNWYQMYDNLKSNNYITYKNQIDENDNSMCYLDSDNKLKILIETDGTIKSLCSLVHEFIHYIYMSSNHEDPPLSIIEFPSIFFERLSAQFLKEKGYSSDIISEIIYERNENNTFIYMELLPIFTDIMEYTKNGPIKKEDKIKFYEAVNQHMLERGEKKIVENIDKKIDKIYDLLIANFINNGLLVINGYQYLLDNFLATEVLKKNSNNPDIIKMMTMITNNLRYMDLQSILDTFDLHNIFNDVSSPKIRKKTNL